jgi:sulfide:quinone oxidoreductase
MAHIVVIGASTGGLPFAYDIKKTLGKDHEVTVISNNPNFNFIPSNPWLAVGWRSADDISFELAPRLKRKNIHLIVGEATQIKPNENQVMVGDKVEKPGILFSNSIELAKLILLFNASIKG